MIVLAVYSIKGGVGKTATAVNLAYLCANSGKRTLLCDLDPQAAATYYFRIKPKVKSGTRSLVEGGKHLSKHIKGSDYDKLDVLPADFAFRNLDLEMAAAKHKKSRLKTALATLKDQYEVVFLDCPPNLTLVTENILNAAHFLVHPLIPTTLSVRTFERLLAFYKEQGLWHETILPFFSMVERRKRLHLETMAELFARYPSMLKTMIPYLADIEKMGLYRTPVMRHLPQSAATNAYLRLWQEITRRMVALLQSR